MLQRKAEMPHNAYGLSIWGFKWLTVEYHMMPLRNDCAVAGAVPLYKVRKEMCGRHNMRRVWMLSNG